MNLEIKIDDITADLLKEFISKDTQSLEKITMKEADKYYEVKNSQITDRKKMMMLFDKDENPYIKEDLSKANNKAKHSYLQEIINQCSNYLVGRPIKIDYKKAFDKVTKDVNKDGIIDAEERKSQSITGDTQSERDKERIDNELYRDNNFTGFIQEVVKDIQLYGKAYMRIVVSENGKIKFVAYDPKEVIMFYNEFDEPVLAIRYFIKPEIVTKGKKKEIENVTYAEVFDNQFKDTWKKDKKGWEKIGKRELVYANKITYGEIAGKTQIKIEPIEVPIFPIIEWKFNSDAIPTLTNIKDFIDLQDTNLSDLANNVEDIQEAIWILENYTGQNLQEFMHDLKVKKAVKVGVGGHAKPETVNIPVEARNQLYEKCRKNIYKFGFAIDFQERDSLGNVSGVALKWSYAPLEQKANSIETNGQEALNNFFNILFKLMGLEYDSNDLEFIFDRTMIANEQEQTATVMSASSVLSQKTTLDNLPMVSDTEDELERLEEENEYDPTIPEGTIETGEEDEEETDDRNETSIFVPVDKSDRK